MLILLVFFGFFATIKAITCNVGEVIYSDGGTEVCRKCPIGTFSNTTEAEKCTPCSDGTYSNAEGASACTECSAGYYQNLYGQSACIECPKGTYTNVTGTKECMLCPRGTYSDTTGKTECTECSKGQYQNLYGQSACIKCPAGTYSDANGATECILCPRGTYSGEAGSSSCTDCPAGKYQNLYGKTSCITCPGGTYQDGTGAVECKICEKGTYSNSGRTGCDGIQGGSYNRNYLTKSQAPCPVNTYQDGTGKTYCKKCPYGTTTEGKTGQTECKPCGIGKYYNYNNGSPTCTNCPKGMYNDMEGQFSCVPCPAGYKTENAGSNSKDLCIQCTGNTYSFLPGSDCKTCRTGYVVTANHTSCEECPLIKDYSSFCSGCGAGKYPVKKYSNVPFSPTGANKDVPLTHKLEFVSGTVYKVYSKSCVGCPVGTFNNKSDNFSIDDCIPCPAGRYNGSTGQTSCKVPANGYYADEEGMDKQKKCPDGWASNVDKTGCTICPPGTYKGPTDTQCEPCTIGTYNPMEGAPSQDYCLKCPINTKGTAAGADDISDCVPCEEGYQSRPGSTSCERCKDGNCKCKAGEIEDEESNECRNCPSGESCYLDLPTTCDDGKFSQGQSAECLDCPENWICGDSAQYHVCNYGYYKDGNKCVKVPTPGINVAYPGTGLIECPNGQYSEDGIKCIACSPNTYINHKTITGEVKCLPCGTDMTSQRGRWECVSKDEIISVSDIN